MADMNQSVVIMISVPWWRSHAAPGPRFATVIGTAGRDKQPVAARGPGGPFGYTEPQPGCGPAPPADRSHTGSVPVRRHAAAGRAGSGPRPGQ
jgi:hypothetical protein